MVASWNVCMLHITYRNTVGLPPFPSSTPLFMDDGIDTALMGLSSVWRVGCLVFVHAIYHFLLTLSSHFRDRRSRHYLIITGSTYQDR